MKWDSKAPMAEAFRADVKQINDDYAFSPGIEGTIAKMLDGIQLLMWITMRLLEERDAKLKEQSNG